MNTKKEEGRILNINYQEDWVTMRNTHNSLKGHTLIPEI